MTPALGAFGVTRTDGWAAWVIRAVTRSTCNHAFVYVGNGNIVEAQPKGATLSPARIYPHAIWSTMPLTDVQRECIAAEALKLVGTPYSWVDDACIGLADLFGWHVPEPVRHRLNRRDRLMCSALVDQAYRDAGVHLFPDGRIPGDVSPGDLEHLIEGEPTATASSQTDAAPITK
jgi:cell wall-associated NlpC family hydrolase